jgi:hypothetical protein
VRRIDWHVNILGHVEFPQGTHDVLDVFWRVAIKVFMDTPPCPDFTSSRSSGFATMSSASNSKAAGTSSNIRSSPVTFRMTKSLFDVKVEYDSGDAASVITSVSCNIVPRLLAHSLIIQLFSHLYEVTLTILPLSVVLFKDHSGGFYVYLLIG